MGEKKLKIYLFIINPKVEYSETIHSSYMFLLLGTTHIVLLCLRQQIVDKFLQLRTDK